MRPPVLLQADIEVRGNSIIGPEVVVGAGCELAEDVHIMQSVPWPRVHVGRGLTIARSIIMNDVAIPGGSHVADRIVSLEESRDL